MFPYVCTHTHKEIVELLPTLLHSLREFSSEVTKAVSSTTEKINSAKQTEIRHDYRFKNACQDFQEMASEAYTFVDKVDDFFYYARSENAELQKVKDAIRRNDFTPLDQLIQKLQGCLIQAEQVYQQFFQACRKAEQSCTTVEEHCKYKAKETKGKKNKTRAVGGTLAGGAMAAGIAGGVAASVVAGVFTFGIGTLVGLGLTAAGSVAAGSVVGGATAVATHVIASNFADLEEAFRDLKCDFNSLRPLASDMEAAVHEAHSKLPMKEMDDYVYTVRAHKQATDNADSICYALDRLCHRCDEYYGVTSLCREEVKQMKEKLLKI